MFHSTRGLVFSYFPINQLPDGGQQGLSSQGRCGNLDIMLLLIATSEAYHHTSSLRRLTVNLTVSHSVPLLFPSYPGKCSSYSDPDHFVKPLLFVSCHKLHG